MPELELYFGIMAGKSTPVLLVTANVGSIFEDVCTTNCLDLCICSGYSFILGNVIFVINVSGKQLQLHEWLG